jgi:hypothetical protein
VTSTNGNALAGSLAATLQAVEIEKLIAGEREHLAAGREILFDARSHALVASRLVRNPTCLFSHERAPIGSAAGLTLRAALALGDGAGASLFVPDSPFVAKLVCERCDCTTEVWLHRNALGERALLCPRCGETRAVRGFDLFERISAETVPGRLLDRPLAERGLRAGEVIGISEGERTHYFALDLERAPSDGATLVVAGLGNIGSFLIPLVARLPSVAGVILCDPDVYEARQVFGQNIAADAAGRSKADFQAERMRAIRPDLRVESFTAPVEHLPLGRLIGAIAVSCLDSRVARLRLAARAWRVGSPFVDAAVGGGASLLARTAVYLPDEGAACFECAFDESDYAALEQVLTCAAST